MRITQLLIASAWLLVLTTPRVWAGQLDERIDGLIANRELGQTKVSVHVIDMRTGRSLASRKPDRPMIPASNMKLLTTTAALDLLSPEFSFKTELALIQPEDLPRAEQGSSDVKPSGQDTPDSAWSKADQAENAKSSGYGLVIRGSGDPAFGDPKLLRKQLDMGVEDFLDQWVHAVAKTGIERFDRLIVDDRIFDQQFVHPSWPKDQLNRWYCAEVAGLNFHDNCLDVLPIPAEQRGVAPRVELFPDAGFIKAINKARTGKDDAFWISRSKQRNAFTFHGRVRHRRSKPFSVTLHDPPMYFGRLLADRLEKRGIQIAKVTRPAAESRPLPGKPLHVVKTALPAVLRRINRDSQNLFAEAMLKRLGYEVTGRPGGFSTGAAAIRLYLRNTLGPRLAASASIADGSGMSRKNQVTARLLTRLLRRMHRSDHAGVFRKTMAYSGHNAKGKALAAGTLSRPDPRFDKLEPGSWVFAKSGYLRSVSALSGYLVMPRATHRPASQANAPSANAAPGQSTNPRTSPNQRYRVVGFSILCNGFTPPTTNRTMKSLQDRIVELLESTLRKEAPALGG